MSERKEGRKSSNTLSTVIMTLCCFGVGFVIGSSEIFSFPEDAGFFEILAVFVLQFAFILLGLYLQVIIHEAGHLLAGLITGYRFLSFRIGNVMLLKIGGKYSFKRFSLAGTSGQCLMIPPDRAPDGTYPYRLYHMGGVLLNLITAAASVTAFCFIPDGNYFGSFLFFFGIFGVILAIFNGIPMRSGGVPTDGYNVIHIGGEPFALDAMWLQLKINESQHEGVRLKDLPAEWFTIPESAAKSNEIIAALAVFSENRAMDAIDFSRAKEQITMLLDGGEYSVIGLYKGLLEFDKVTIDLIENGANADISALERRELKTFRRSMAKYPAVIRTEYAVSVLKKNDPVGAQKKKALFEKVAEKYPLVTDIASEREIMDYISEKAGGFYGRQ